MPGVELVAPGGTLEKARAALAYGADAVYVGGPNYSLRAGAGNLTLEEIALLLREAHRMGRRVYVAVNMLAHNRHLAGIETFLDGLSIYKPDAVILSDPAVLTLVHHLLPETAIHISTQASVTNWAAAEFWRRFGARRIVAARELSLKEIAEIKAKSQVEVEAFVHGAMCMAYSGRCLLSAFLTGRSANLGDCAQPCRWRYAVVEEKRPGEYIPVVEEDSDTFLFNSKDLCMLEHLPELLRTGVDALKIEGRMKSMHYVATVVGTYRQALDRYFQDPDGYRCSPELVRELEKVSHRPYSTGFYLGSPEGGDVDAQRGRYIRRGRYVGLVENEQELSDRVLVSIRDTVNTGARIEWVRPGLPLEVSYLRMFHPEEGSEVQTAHPNHQVYVPVDFPAPKYTVLREQGIG